MRPWNDVDFPIHDLMRQRWSPRAFADKRVEPAKIRSILEAARWAPSSFNEQPWRYILATKDDPEAYARMLGCLVDANQAWARTAPLLMISCAVLHFARNGKPNRHAYHDLGAASAMLTIQATVLGLHVHQMAGIHVDKIRETYQVPPDADPVAGMAVGYLGAPELIAEDRRAGETTPSTRRQLQEFVWSGRWGNPANVQVGRPEQDA